MQLEKKTLRFKHVFLNTYTEITQNFPYLKKQSLAGKYVVADLGQQAICNSSLMNQLDAEHLVLF